MCPTKTHIIYSMIMLPLRGLLGNLLWRNEEATYFLWGAITECHCHLVFYWQLIRCQRGWQKTIQKDENPLSPPLLLSSIPHICHLDHQYIGGEKIGHVEKFQISIHDRCGEIWNFSTCRGISNFSHNRCGEIIIFAKFGGISKFYTWQMWRNLKFTLFLVVKSVLWQFTLFFA